LTNRTVAFKGFVFTFEAKQSLQAHAAKDMGENLYAMARDKQWVVKEN
jgi:hypothetical protein